MVPIIEQMKVVVRNSREMQAETQKNIGKIKRNPQNIYRGAEHPKRTWQIMSRGVRDLRTRSDHSIDEVLLQRPSGQTSKRVQGFKVNPAEERIDLRDVAQQDNNNLMKRMGNLEKNFMNIPLN